MAVVDIEEEAYFTHLCDDISCLLQDLQENGTFTVRLKSGKLCGKEAVQFLFKRVKQFSLLMIFGEIVDIVIGKLIRDVGTASSEELIDVRCELFHQFLALSTVL